MPLPISTSESQVYKSFSLYLVFVWVLGNPNSGLHTCTKGILPTEPPPQPHDKHLEDFHRLTLQAS